MTVSVYQFLVGVFTALFIGGTVAWYIRQQRIKELEKMLRHYQQKLLKLEMEYGNLEAFVQNLKDIGNQKKRSSIP